VPIVEGVAEWEAWGPFRRSSAQKGSEVGIAGDAKLNGKSAQPARARERVSGVAEWRGFINVNLNASQKAQFEDWLLTGEVWDILAAVVGSGAHIAIKLDQSSGGFMASITQRNPDHVNAGLAVTARSSLAEKALFRTLYLVQILGVDADWSVGQAPADPDRW